MGNSGTGTGTGTGTETDAETGTSLDVLFPECCYDCSCYTPVSGTCDCDYSQTLADYFAHNPDSPC
ncbi:MAG: hypothetical protein SXQ77_12170, partial [Halobacteria archaeon]|nr:hypothetical protein [Halobacteria archaeon]